MAFPISECYQYLSPRVPTVEIHIVFHQFSILMTTFVQIDFSIYGVRSTLFRLNHVHFASRTLEYLADTPYYRKNCSTCTFTQDFAYRSHGTYITEAVHNFHFSPIYSNFRGTEKLPLFSSCVSWCSFNFTKALFSNVPCFLHVWTWV